MEAADDKVGPRPNARLLSLRPWLACLLALLASPARARELQPPVPIIGQITGAAPIGGNPFNNGYMTLRGDLLLPGDAIARLDVGFPGTVRATLGRDNSFGQLAAGLGYTYGLSKKLGFTLPVHPSVRAQFGPASGSISAYLLDSGMFGGYPELFAIAVTSQSVGEFLGVPKLRPLEVGASFGIPIFNDMAWQAAVGWRWQRFALSVAMRGEITCGAPDSPACQNEYMVQLGVRVYAGALKALPIHLPFVAREAPELQMDVTEFMKPGRVYVMRQGPLRVREDAAVPKLLTSTCVVDEELATGVTIWSHMSCLTDLPPDSPSPWRTGCYASTIDGVWRLPNCPSELPVLGRYPELVIQARSDTLPHFVALGEQPPEKRTFMVGKESVTAVCRERALDTRIETCAAADWGVVWAAHRWGLRTATTPEMAATLVTVRDDGLVDPLHPHLEFRDTASAECEMSPACAVFGACHSFEGRCAPESDLDCRTARVCVRDGRCHLRNGGCEATEHSDCRGSSGCADDGMCTSIGGRCRAEENDCATATTCLVEGHCVPVLGRCVSGEKTAPPAN